MEEFFTTDAAEEGVKLTLYTPAGKRTDQWICIRSILSDEFRRERLLMERATALKGLQKAAGVVENDDDILDKDAKLLAPLVKSWSFDDPCTRENVEKFLRKAPQIADLIDRESGNRKRFFDRPSHSLKTTQEPTSSSSVVPTAQKQAPENT